MSFAKIKNKINLLLAIIQFKIKIGNHKYIFIFPYYHIGGGERVHIDIMGLFDNKDVFCIIANKSINDALKSDFEKVSTVFDIGKYNFSHELISKFAKKSAKIASTKTVKTIFGSNNYFFYLFIQNIKSNTKIIDLTHAFTYENIHAIEKISLPFINKVDQRIVLGNKTLNDFKQLYKTNNLDPKLLERFKIIKNAINIPENFKEKTNSTNLQVLFVSRNSPEKRPELLFKIIDKCSVKKLPFCFTIIGDFSGYYEAYSNFDTVKFIGEVNNTDIINKHYKNADVLLITSIREGLPMVVLEAMANSATIISTNVGEIFEIINTENNNGILIDNLDDIEDLSDKFIENLINLNANKPKLLNLQKNAYQSVKKDYNKTEFRKNYINTIEFL